MKRIVQTLLWLFLLCAATPIWAESALLQVNFLSMDEAASLVRSQLSEQGSVVVIASRRTLVVDDSAAHIRKARQLLARLDRMPAQYVAQVEIADLRADALEQSSAQVQVSRISGGWRALTGVSWQQMRQQSSHRQRFQLRISAAQPGMVEVGTLRSFSQQSRRWLAGYRLMPAQGATVVPMRSGFQVMATPLGEGAVRIHLVPWMQHEQPQFVAHQEMLLGLGTPGQPARPPVNQPQVRLNGEPQLQESPHVDLVGAATTLVVHLGEPVTIAAVDQEAARLGDVWLGRYGRMGRRSVVIHLQLTQ